MTAVTPPAPETPLMQQYRDIKAHHPETILFFRMGDFYEMFEDDAKLAARELGLTLTSRNNGGAAAIPLAGVPVKAATEYLRRLIAKGHRVAIAEQIEDPKLAKGVVRRAVVETVTPGTVLTDDWLVRNRNNYIVAVDPRGTAAGLAILDVTTGELIFEVVPTLEIEPALGRYDARELVLPADSAVATPAATVTTRDAWEFDAELARDDLMRTSGIASLDGLGIGPDDRPALGAAGALLRYARELKPGGLPHLAHPTMVRRGDVMPLDEMTRRNLELVEPLRAGAEGATLLEVIDRTLTPMGGRLLRRWLLAPLVDPAAINPRPAPAQVEDGDSIKAGYDRELDDVKAARDGGKQYIAGLQSRERERTGIASLKVGFNKVFGYYIEVTHTHRARIPSDYERRQTLTGAERYVTPELKEYEAKVLGAEERIAAREAAVLDQLRRRVGDAIARVQATAGHLARCDVWAALADVAERERYVRPDITDDFTLALEGSRHPVVERMMPREAFIPNDVTLDEGGRVALLTGPNMAGKSTVLRQVGLCVVLAQIGSFVPCRRARIGVVDRLFTRVGASDNLVRGQSTFMVEMSETSAILHAASARSLVLLDEIGRGTSTYDGCASAWTVAG